MHADYLLAWLLPLFAGAGMWWLANGRRVFHGGVAASIGTGWIVGVFMAAVCVRWIGRDDTMVALGRAMPWLLSLGAITWLLVAVRLHRRARATVAAQTRNAHVERSRPMTRARRVAWGLLLALIGLRFMLLGDEASLRPIFPWDAWSAWAIKPKTWMLLGQADTYVSMLDWLAHPAAATRTAATWHYPELLAWIEIWFASGAGGWNEPLVDLAWGGALAALALAAYGYWRGLGLTPLVAIGLVYALVSLPLIDAHVALAGYADLWIAVTLGMATMAWSRWLVYRERGQWVLGVALSLCLPAIKLEGAIWTLAFSAVVVLDLLPPRWRWRVAGVVVAAIGVGLLMGGFALPMLGLGWVHVAWGEVTIPSIPPFILSWHPVGGAMLASLFTLPNWHLLWYVFPVLVVLCWRVLWRDHAARLLGLFVLLQAAFLFVLFFFTSAAAWAQDFTSANRLILQVVPDVFVFVALLLRGVAAGDSSPVAPSRGVGARASEVPILPA